METLVTVTLRRLGADDAARGLGEVLGSRLAGVLRGGDSRSLLTGVEEAARCVALVGTASLETVTDRCILICDQLALALGRRPEPSMRDAAERLAGLRTEILRSIATGYAAGLRDTISALDRLAGATLDDVPGVTTCDEIVDQIALELLRCERMDLALGVVEIGVEVPGGACHACSRGQFARLRRDMAVCLRGGVRRYDGVGLSRNGGFLLVLPGVSRHGLAAVAGRLCEEIGRRIADPPRLAVVVAHHDDGDVTAREVLTSLERGLDVAWGRGGSLAWAA